MGAVVADGEVLQAAEAVANQIAANSQSAVRSAKETALEIVGRSLDYALRLEALHGYSSFGSGSELRGLKPERYSGVAKAYRRRFAIELDEMDIALVPATLQGPLLLVYGMRTASSGRMKASASVNWSHRPAFVFWRVSAIDASSAALPRFKP